MSTYLEFEKPIAELETKVSELRKLAEATPGPWPLDRVDEVDDPGWTVECSRWRGFLNTVDFGPDRATARLVSEAPALLAQLLATIEDLRRSTH